MFHETQVPDFRTSFNVGLVCIVIFDITKAFFYSVKCSM